MANAKENRQRLESILGTSSTANLSSDIPDIDNDLTPQELFTDDIDALMQDCTKEATKLINQSIKHIFTKEMIRDNPYIKDKMKIDIESLAGMLYQNRSAVIMQKTLMSEVKSGAASPRYFEVFAVLNKSIAENNKQLLTTVEAIKATYQGIKVDIIEKQAYAPQVALPESNNFNAITDGNISFTQGGGVCASGTKDMINLVKSAIMQAKQDEEND